MTNAQYEFMTSLQYENMDMKRQLREFKSGEKYISMRAAHKKQLEAEYARNRKLEAALAQMPYCPALLLEQLQFLLCASSDSGVLQRQRELLRQIRDELESIITNEEK